MSNDSRILYDITTESTALNFLVQQFGVTSYAINEYINDNLETYNVDELIEHFGYDINTIRHA